MHRSSPAILLPPRLFDLPRVVGEPRRRGSCPSPRGCGRRLCRACCEDITIFGTELVVDAGTLRVVQGRGLDTQQPHNILDTIYIRLYE